MICQRRCAVIVILGNDPCSSDAGSLRVANEGVLRVLCGHTCGYCVLVSVLCPLQLHAGSKAWVWRFLHRRRPREPHRLHGGLRVLLTISPRRRRPYVPLICQRK